jgi:hypothetical protein
MKSKLGYTDYITKSILLNNEFGIEIIKDIENIKSMILIREEYPKLAELIKNKSVEAIKSLAPSQNKTSEYLTILKFRDQENNNYIVTTYDSDELWQDPQVIDIFRI